MGARIALASALALHDSNCRYVPMEFSLAAIFSSRISGLFGGGFAFNAALTGPGSRGAWTRRFDKPRRIDLPYNWFVRFSAHFDFYWIGCGLGLFGIPATQLRFSFLGARGNYILRPSCHVSLPPDKLQSAAI